MEIIKSDNHKIAFVHDWLFGLRGGEYCLLAFICLYKDSDVYSLFYQKGATHTLVDKRFKRASLLNKIPDIKKIYRALLPLFPGFSCISELKNYPVKISLSHAVSKNIKGSQENCRHICYCFTPMRYIWDQGGRYLGWKMIILFPLILFLRIWDKHGSKSVTDFVAISSFVAARIRKYYGRRSKVIFPPIAFRWLDSNRSLKPDLLQAGEKAYLFAGALVPYKGADLAVKLCTESGRALWVAGSGPELENLKKIAGPNIKFLGKVSDQELAYLLNSCRALLFPCKEDFGILPLEANAAGKAVIALYAGACKETIKGCKHWILQDKNSLLAGDLYTGVFIKQTQDSRQIEEFSAAIKFFEEHESGFHAEACIKQAMKFGAGNFYDSWVEFASGCPELQSQKLATREDFVAEYEGLRLSGGR